jgi:CO/xanthine dehydrogenase Mo-binding subunit
MPTVGQNISRLDGIPKVTGQARYVGDVELPDMWHGAVVRAPVASGRIRSVAFDPAFDWSRVAVADARDIPGRNCVAMIEDDLPLIVDGVVKHRGEAVALIAAPTRELALEARRHVAVDAEEWEPVLSIEESKRARVKLRGDDNVIAHYTITKGDVDAAFAAADIVIEGVYEAGHQEHIYIEPQGMIAAPRADGGLDVVGSLQCPYYVSRALSILLAMPEERISVRQAVVGGAFGGKEDYPSVLAGYCAVLAKKCGRPVKIVYDRAEDTEVTTKRHPALVRHRTAVAADGTLAAMEIDFELDAGAYVTLTPVVLSRGLLHSAGAYRCPNVRARGTAYATNTPPNGAFRGFGAPQAIFPVEVHMDRVAAAVGLSPLEFRRRNCLRAGDTTSTGQVLRESVGAPLVLEEAAKRSDFDHRAATLAKAPRGRVRRGIGMALFLHGAGFTGSGEAILKGEAGLRLDPDGRITVLTACTEMGQGAHTVLPQIAADHLGVDLACIGIETPDTALVPNSGPTVASRTTMIMGVVLGKCAAALRAKLFAFAAECFGREASSFAFRGDAIFSGEERMASVAELVQRSLAERGPLTVIDHYELPPDIHWDPETYRGDAYPTYAWGCDVAEVEVDLDTFEVRVVKMWLAIELGRAVNPLMAAGQVEGGTLQALGYGTMERHALERGRFLTNRLQTYLIPTAADAPEMETILLEEPYSQGPMGAKGLGELPMDGGAPAIVNAIAHATGLSVTALPATAERLYESWKKAQSG